MDKIACNNPQKLVFDSSVDLDTNQLRIHIPMSVSIVSRYKPFVYQPNPITVCRSSSDFLHSKSNMIPNQRTNTQTNTFFELFIMSPVSNLRRSPLITWCILDRDQVRLMVIISDNNDGNLAGHIGTNKQFRNGMRGWLVIWFQW